MRRSESTSRWRYRSTPPPEGGRTEKIVRQLRNRLQRGNTNWKNWANCFLHCARTLTFGVILCFCSNVNWLSGLFIFLEILVFHLTSAAFFFHHKEMASFIKSADFTLLFLTGIWIYHWIIELLNIYAVKNYAQIFLWEFQSLIFITATCLYWNENCVNELPH